MKAKENPWKGLQPYIDSKDDLTLHPFCGRENVVREMFDLIDNNIITTLYGKSGIGKTSLLNAGLFPKLREEDYIPVYVRLGTDRLKEENFAKCIVRTIEKKARGLTNRSEQYLPEQESEKIDYLWTYFASHSFFAPNDNVKFPVIVLDQFEEVFNENIDTVKLLLLQLRELASDRLLPNNQEFKVNFRFVISIREDDLYLLEDAIDSYYIPEFKANRYRLKALSKKEAIRIIEVRETNNKALYKDLFDIEHFEEIVDSIINTATSKDHNSGINTQVLSLCCFLLYNNICEKEGKIINLENTKELKGNLIGVFYDEATKSLTDAQRKIFEEHLVTDNNRRLAWSKKAFLDIICYCENNPQKEKDFLTGQYSILRNIKTHGEKCVELIHDMLAEIVANRKAHRKNREKNKQRRANKMNVLSPKGRKLIDNALEFDCDLDKFGEENKWRLDSCIKMCLLMESQTAHRIQNIGTSDKSRVSLQKLLDDPQLQNVTIRLEFIDENGLSTLTSDGIYSIDVKYKDNKVSEMLFFDSPNTIDSNGMPCPIYLNGGFCGIRIDYNGELEIKRTYLQWDGENFVPTHTAGGYAAIEFEEFDEYGNPQRTIYKDNKGKLCMHKNGNYGFLSEYDEDGFEKRRIFINEKGEYDKIISGVCGRELYYDITTGLLTKETYLGTDLQPVRDMNNYCTAEFERDYIGRITKETYYDEFGKLCNSKYGYVSEVSEYFDECNTKYCITSFRDINNNPIQHADGYWMFRSDYDTFGYICGISILDQSRNPIHNEITEFSKMQFIYDERHWLVGLRKYGESEIFDLGLWVDYNRTRTHVVRMGYLSADNQKSFLSESDEVAAVELRDINTEEGMPLLNVFLDNLNQPMKNSSGYVAYRRWEEKRKWFDDNNRTVKEMYYDSFGKPMTDNTGAYGLKYEYDDVLLIQNICNIDANEKKINDQNGICRIETHFTPNGKERKQLFYDKDDVRCANYDGVFEYKYEWTSNYLKKTSINLDINENPTDKELGFAYLIEEMDKNFHSKVMRKYYLDANQNIVIVDSGFYIKEFSYDKNGEQIEIKNIGPKGYIMTTNSGYAIMRIEKSDNGLLKKEMYLDEKEQSVMSNDDGYSMIEILKDKEGRILKKVFYDTEYKPLQLNDGTYGTAYEYTPNGNTIIEMNLDELGKLTNDVNGIAKHIIEVDEKGRKIKEIYYDIKGNALQTEEGDYGKLWQYNDTLEENTEIIISIDSDEQLMINNHGYSIIKTRFDKNNHPSKISFFDTKGQPTLSRLQFHSINYKYNEDYTVRKRSYQDIDENACSTNSGIAEEIEFYDSEGHVILEYRLDLAGNLIPYNITTYSIKREYINSQEWKEFHLGIDGHLCNDPDGVAYQHICKDEKERITFNMRFDIEGKAVADAFGDYGESSSYIDDQNAQFCTGLDIEGNPHINKFGFVSQFIIRNADNRIIKRIFLDENNNPTATIDGKFGLDIDYIDEHTTKTTSLNKELKPFAPPQQGYASEIKTIDDEERITRLFWLDSEEKPYSDSDDDSGIEFVYANDMSHKIEINLNKQGNPHINRQGYAKRIIEFDQDGNEKRILWLDVDNNPIANANGDYGIMTDKIIDIPNGQIIAYLDANGEPHKCSEGWTYKMEIINEDNQTKEYRYFDAERNPVEDQDGDVAYRKEVDEKGNITFVSLNKDGNPYNNKRGYAKRIVSLDDQERITKELWFTKNDEPFADEDGDFGIMTIFNDEERSKTVIYLDAKENPRHSNSRPYSATKFYRDEFGRDIKIIFLGNELQPVDQGDNSFGRLIEFKENSLFTSIEINIDAEGRPCKNSTGYVKKLMQKDEMGRLLLEVYTDSEDNILIDTFGDCATEYIYSTNPNILIIDSLDENLNPHVNNMGYYREIRMTAPSGNVNSVFFDLLGNIIAPEKSM